MITKSDFMKLRCGDVIVIRTPKGRMYRRTVIAGPADDTRTPPCEHITLPKRVRSQYDTINTGYFWNDIKHQILDVMPKRNPMAASFDEIELILRYNPKPTKTAIERMNYCQRLTHDLPRVRDRLVRTVAALRKVGL